MHYFISVMIIIVVIDERTKTSEKLKIFGKSGKSEKSGNQVSQRN